MLRKKSAGSKIQTFFHYSGTFEEDRLKSGFSRFLEFTLFSVDYVTAMASE